MSPTEHDYGDAAYVAGWEAQAPRRRPYRDQVFATIAEQLRADSRVGLRVLELGSGPGFLASHLVGALDVASYELLDVSPPMHALARERLARDGRLSDAVSFVVGDLTTSTWTRALGRDRDVIVTNQAIHEVGSGAAIRRVYRDAATVLRPGGRFLVCDRVNDGREEALPHLLTVSEHVDALIAAGVSARPGMGTATPVSSTRHIDT